MAGGPSYNAVIMGGKLKLLSADLGQLLRQLQAIQREMNHPVIHPHIGTLEHAVEGLYSLGAALSEVEPRK